MQQSAITIDENNLELHSYTGVQFYHDEMCCVSCQASTDDLKVWDLRNSESIKQTKKSKTPKKKINKYQPFMVFNKFLAQDLLLERMHQQLQLQFSFPDLNIVNQLHQQYKTSIENDSNYLSTLNAKSQALQSGSCSLSISSSQNYLLTTTTYNELHLYALNSLETPPKIFKGFRGGFYVKASINETENLISCGGDDKKIRFWNTEHIGQKIMPVIELESANNGEINQVAMGRNNEGNIASVADDGIVSIWGTKTSEF